MPTDHRAALAKIKRFDQLIAYLRDEMGWPIAKDSFENVDDLFYDFTADELGIDAKSAAKIVEIKRLRPLSTKQPWGIFFVKFEPKKLPVAALRRILSQVALKKRASANSADHTAWAKDDLLFVSNYGEGDERTITFAHFSQDSVKQDLPVLKVLGWNEGDTALHLDGVASELTSKLTWPSEESDVHAWRKQWRSAFTVRHGEIIATSKDMSIRLAQLARAIRDRIKTVLAIETENGPITKLMKAFQEALVHDLDADGFADMYAQTIAYGLLSARIADPKAATADHFAEHMRTNPFLKELMETFLRVGGRKGKAGGPGIDFDELGVSDVVDLLDAANMEAVVRDFGDKNPQEDPVIHFYELFLKEYDAKKRMQRGVFYTPRPVVSYIVRSVHELLQTEFGLADGLADTATWGEMAKRYEDLTIPEGVKPTDRFVTILDPATGTGTFLVQCIEVIHRTLVEKWKREGRGEKKTCDLWNDYVPKHLLPRLHGYELLMAPYAIAHLKIGLKLHETGYRFESDERARIYLTNALEPAHDFSGKFEFMIPALAHEAEAVNEIKQKQRFTVVIGNPPYAGHSANSSKDAQGRLNFIGNLIEEYKKGCPELHKPAQAKWLQDDYVKFIRVAQWMITQASAGILGFITNHSYLDNPTFRGMRKSLVESFSHIRVLDLHGSSKKKEVAPDGGREENIFDIQQGVAIILGATLSNRASRADVRHADYWGTRESKYAFLSSATYSTSQWHKLLIGEPSYLFIPQNAVLREEYERGWKITQIFSENGDPAPGVVTTQDQFAIAFTKREIVQNVESLLETRTEAEARKLFRLCTQSQWDYKTAKRELSDGKWRRQIGEILYRPFDLRWTVYNRYVAVHRRERVTRHMLGGKNVALVTARSNRSPSMDHFFCSRFPTETKCGESTIQSYLIPVFLYPDDKQIQSELALGSQDRSNINKEFFDLLRTVLGAGRVYLSPEDIFHYAYAVFHSPNYRKRYMEFLKIDFPRLLLTSSLNLFCNLTELGGELVKLHLMESPKLDKHLTELIGPQRPKVEKVSYADETVWIDKAQSQGFSGVPENVWRFEIGGYQVCEKWLKDRKDRILTADDIAHYHRIVIALHETIRLMREIDEVIEKHGGWPGAFQGATKASEDGSERFLKAAESSSKYDSET